MVHSRVNATTQTVQKEFSKRLSSSPTQTTIAEIKILEGSDLNGHLRVKSNMNTKSARIIHSTRTITPCWSLPEDNHHKDIHHQEAVAVAMAETESLVSLSAVAAVAALLL